MLTAENIGKDDGHVEKKNQSKYPQNKNHDWVKLSVIINQVLFDD